MEPLEKPIGTDIAQRFIRKLTIKNYHPNKFINPDLHKFYLALQSHAGIQDDGAEEDYRIDPKFNEIENRIGGLLKEFKRKTMGDAFDGVAVAKIFGTSTGKRARETAQRNEIKKQAKLEDLKLARSNLVMSRYVDAYQRNMLHSFKVAELRSYMRAWDLDYEDGTRKAQIIPVVRRHLKQYMRENNIVH